MYNTFLIIQILGILGLAGAIIFVVSRRKTKEQSILLAIGIAVLVNLLGYLGEVTSVNEEAALMAVKMSYIGKCFICWMMVYFILVYYKCRYSRRLLFSMLIVHMIIYASIFTCELHSLYYTDIKFVVDGDFPHLVLSHGFFYFLHMGISYIYACVIGYLSLRHFHRNRGTIEAKISVIICCVTLLPFMASVFGFLGVFYPYDLMDVSILIGTVIFAFYVLKYRLYETVDIGKDTILDGLDEMLFITNSNFELLYDNNIVKETIPSRVLENKNAQRKLLKNIINSNDSQYEYNGKYYDVNVKEMQRYNSINGYIVMLNDITDHIRHSSNLEYLVSQKTNQIERMKQKTITNFANIIELRDDITGMHVKRTSEYVRMLSAALMKNGIYTETIDDVYVDKICHAAPLHDVGKITISDVILKKPGFLEASEFEKIKQHTIEGRRMIEKVLSEETDEEYIEMAKDMAYFHHEKWDGTGYPEGKRGAAIPLCARIMAVADVFDALTSQRSYKESFPTEEAFNILLDSKGSHFEPILVDVFYSIKDDVVKICEDYKCSNTEGVRNYI